MNFLCGANVDPTGVSSVDAAEMLCGGLLAVRVSGDPIRSETGLSRGVDGSEDVVEVKLGSGGRGTRVLSPGEDVRDGAFMALRRGLSREDMAGGGIWREGERRSLPLPRRRRRAETICLKFRPSDSSMHDLPLHLHHVIQVISLSI